MKTDLLLSKLRNPYGQNEEERRQIRLLAADRIERWRDAYNNLAEFAVSQGLDITTTGKGDKQTRVVVSRNTSKKKVG